MPIPPRARGRSHLLLAAVLVAGGLFSPASAFARSSDPEREVLDARLEGYRPNDNDPPVNVTLEGGTTGTLIFGGLLGVLCLAGLFKDSKRTHLD